LARAPYQGVKQIVSFNWPKYAVTAAMLCIAMAVWPMAGAWVHAGMLAFVVPALYWMIVSIAVSHYVYDRCALYDFSWLHTALATEPRRWVNIHAGLDETSELIEAQLGGEVRGDVVDIFDARTMTEPSIERARQQVKARRKAIRARHDRLPFEDRRFDAAFLIFAAHELRKHAQRVRLFKEITRVLSADGELVLMEHMRDGWNYAAFGPGALHFFPRWAWMRAMREAGLELKGEFARTPFVRVFVLQRAR
jgi:SAM-dependent methyltransferase